jgi:hypothetical protein
MRSAILLASAIGLALGGCAGAAPSPTEGSTGAWTAPAGWKSETIPFPLSFAPSIERRGAVDLRFSPGFMKLGAPDFWSYVVAWRLDDDRPLDAASVSADLMAYYRGLVSTVNAETHRVPAVDAARFTAHLEANPKGLSGEVETYDPFVTGRVVTLRTVARTVTCASGRPSLVLMLSPAAEFDPVWASLESVAGAFKC